MSLTYNDLPLTSFPDSNDIFMQSLNITAMDAPLVKQYFTAVQNSDFVTAQAVFAQIPQGSQKILTAQGLNKFNQALMALERFYGTDIETYINSKQVEWESIIENFSYQGIYNPTEQYQLNNYVSYTLSGVTNLYIATSQPPIGSVPSNTLYWRVLSINGARGLSGVGMSFIGDWVSTNTYSLNDCVNYDDALWGCIQGNVNQTPYEGSPYWQLIYIDGVTVYPVTQIQPAVQEDGALWFKIVN